MKTLYLIRHAKSSWDDLDLTDLDRPLNDRGIKDAPRMGKRLKERKVFPDLVLSSPAVRALETCKAITKSLDFPKEKIKIDKRIYHATEDQLLKIVQELKDLYDDDEVVMIFGHNPGLTAFANSLLNLDIDNIPTCGIIAASMNINFWKDTEFGSGDIKFFDFPKNKID